MMTDETQVLSIINENYSMNFDAIEFVRDSGCVAYTVYANGRKYFLRIIKPMFFDTASKSLDIHLFLQKRNVGLEDDGYVKSKKVYERLLQEYLKYSSLTRAEIEDFYDLIALYHFALQATIIEIFGLDCVDNEFLDRQLDWLYNWQEQCKKNGGCSY